MKKKSLNNINCYYSFFHFDIINLIIIQQNDCIVRISFDINDIIGENLETDIIISTKKQLLEYFLKQRKDFDIPVLLIGTEFQKKVWNSLLEIPYGETVSYKYIAEKINHPKSFRAVGNANNKNPLPIIFPCHRVIGSNKELIGYAGGLPVKKYLLNIEQ